MSDESERSADKCPPELLERLCRWVVLHWQRHAPKATQTEFAGMLGISQPTLNRYAQRTGAPSVGTIYKIWQVWKTPPSRMFLEDLEIDETYPVRPRAPGLPFRVVDPDEPRPQRQPQQRKLGGADGN